MIPKIIHYCWFGKNPKDKVILSCIDSWKKYASDFVIKEWTEDNFDIAAHPFTRKMYEQKHWAFVSDYARLAILEREGGIYLDTDILLVKPIAPIVEADCLLGEEEPRIISAGVIGAKAHHPFIIACKEYYDVNTQDRITIPRVLTKIFSQYQQKDEITVYPPIAFYPFNSEEIKNYKTRPLSPETYAIHLWNYSWGHPLNKFFKKIGIYTYIKKTSEKLRIKEILKKIFKFV